MNYKHRRYVTHALAVATSVLVPIVIASATENANNAAGVVQASRAPQMAAPGSDGRLRRSDAAVRVDVRKVLKADRALDDSRITVKSINNGVVFLSGIAASMSDSQRAFRLTAQRPGVLGVFSEIEAVDAIAGPPRVSYPGAAVRVLPVRQRAVDADDAIRRGVTRALMDLDARENADVHVRVMNGVVWLTGSVPTWEGNSSRLYAARSVTGVRSINNRLRVVGPDVDSR